MSSVRAVAAEPVRGAAAAPPPLYPRLSPGPGQSRAAVASHQRARLYAAMIELVAEHGYGALTVRELVGAAGVSTRAFYRHFPGGKEQCLLATHELIVHRSARRVIAAQEGCTDRRERLRLAVGAFGTGIARNPKAARLALVDTFAVWPAALVRMQCADSAFEALIAAGSARAADRTAAPLIVKGIVCGIERVTRARLLAGSERELPRLADELVQWVLCYRSRATTTLGQPAHPGAPARSRGEVLAERALAEQRLHRDERARILAAAARLAAADGYWRLSAPRIRAAAGVSRRSFDAHFDSVQDCFFAAVELTTAGALARARAGAEGREWPAGTVRALRALCVLIARDPVLARLGFVEVLAPGPAGVRHRERQIASVAADFRAGVPLAQRPSRLAAEAAIGAVWGVIQCHVATGRAQQLPRIAPALAYLALAPAIGARAAREAIAVEHARMRAVVNDGRGGRGVGPPRARGVEGMAVR